jgi:hypothetical protein
LNILTPRISATTKKTTKTKKIIFAIDAAPAAISVNPKIEAINAMTKKIKDHLSIILEVKVRGLVFMEVRNDFVFRTFKGFFYGAMAGYSSIHKVSSAYNIP